MFFRKHQTPEERTLWSQIITFVLVQGAIFTSSLFISDLFNTSYGLVLVIGAVIILLFIIPSHFELSGYFNALNRGAGNHKEETVHEILKTKLGWRDNLERLSIGLIPLIVGMILSFT